MTLFFMTLLIALPLFLIMSSFWQALFIVVFLDILILSLVLMLLGANTVEPLVGVLMESWIGGVLAVAFAYLISKIAKK